MGSSGNALVPKKKEEESEIIFIRSYRFLHSFLGLLLQKSLFEFFLLFTENYLNWGNC